MYEAGDHVVQEIAEMFGIARLAIYRRLERDTHEMMNRTSALRTLKRKTEKGTS